MFCLCALVMMILQGLVRVLMQLKQYFKKSEILLGLLSRYDIDFFFTYSDLYATKYKIK